MLNNRPCDVTTAEELDREIRNIFVLDEHERSDEINGILNVYYTDESVRQASLIPVLETRGVVVVWHKK